MYKQFSNAQAIYEGGCVVSSLAGTRKAGCRNGSKGQAQFNFPTSMAVDKDGDIYVADYNNHRLRKITMADGTVQTVAGTGEADNKDGPAREAQFQCPRSIAISDNGDVFIAECSNRVRVFSPTSKTVRSIAVYKAGLSSTSSVAITADGSVLLSDSRNNSVVKIRAGAGSIDTVAGDGELGYKDGEARQAQFRCPCGIAESSNGDIYVVDSGNKRLRKIDAHTGVVSTVAGTGAQGWRDGDASEAQFNDPWGLAIGSDGCVYVCERDNHCIRKFEPAHGRVTTVAGTGKGGVRDGGGIDAQFSCPEGLAFGHDGVLYVADSGTNRIRAITLPRKKEPKFSESEFEDIEKKLEEKTRQMNELAQEIHEATASTLAARENLEKTKDATTEATKELAETQKALKVKHLELRAVWEQRKAELQMVESEIAKMESTKVESVAGLSCVKAESAKAQTVLEKVIAEKTKFAEELARVGVYLEKAREKHAARVGVYLEKARGKHAMERSTGFVVGLTSDGLKDEKSKDLSDKRKTKTDQDDDSREVAGDIPDVISGIPAPVENRAPTEGPQNETAVSIEWTARHGKTGKGKGSLRPAATYEEASEAASACDREEQRGVPGESRQDEFRGTGGTACTGTSDNGVGAAQETSRLHGA